MSVLIEVVYKARNNPNSAIFSQTKSGVTSPIDFSTATRMVVSFDNSTVIADSNVDSTLFDWTDAGLATGEIEFNFNTLGITASTEYQSATLVVYDPTHPLGQVITHLKNRELAFLFCDAVQA